MRITIGLAAVAAVCLLAGCSGGAANNSTNAPAPAATNTAAPVATPAPAANASASANEIAGCVAFWAWLRQGKSILWLAPGVVSLVLFAYLLTLLPSDHAGRAYAAYGGIYIVASLFWLWVAEGQKPDVWDIAGGSVAILAALLILFAPRST